MPVKKISDFVNNLTNGSIQLTEVTGENAVTRTSLHYVEMKPGGDIKPHVHDRTEMYIFLTGRALVMTGKDIIEVTTGDVAIAPAGTPHGIKVIGSEPLRWYAANTPPASTCAPEPAPEEYLWKWERL